MSDLLTWAEAHPALAIAGGVLALLLVGGAVALLWLVVARIRKAQKSEDALTYLAAAIATAVAATGTWKFFDEELSEVPGWLRILTFAFIEIAVIASATRGRRKMRRQAARLADSGNTWEKPSAGIDGLAVWALTLLSGVLATIEADSAGEGVLRMAAPLVAAWLWERGMAVEREELSKRPSSIAWKLTPERILVRLGLADPTERDAGEVAVERYLTRVALAANAVRQTPDSSAWWSRRRRALRRLHKRMDQAVEYAGLATDPARMEALMERLRVLYHTAALPQVDLTAPWRQWEAEPVETVRVDPDPDPDPEPNGGGRSRAFVELSPRPVNGHALPVVPSAGPVGVHVADVARALAARSSAETEGERDTANASERDTTDQGDRDVTPERDTSGSGVHVTPEGVHERERVTGALLAAQPSGAAAVRMAITAMGVDVHKVMPTEISDFLAGHGIQLSGSQVRSELRRIRSRHADKAEVIRLEPGVTRRTSGRDT